MRPLTAIAKTARASARDAVYKAAFIDAARHNLATGTADALAASRYGEEAGGVLSVMRGAVEPGSTATSGWGAELIETALGAFVEGLAPVSAAAELISRANPLPLKSKMNLPTADAATMAMWVAETGEIPAVSGNMDAAPLEPRKLAVMATVSGELLRRTASDAPVRLLLDQAVAKALDLSLFGSDAGNASRPAGLLNGVTATPAGGNPITDIQALVGAVAALSGGQIVIVAHPVQAVAIGASLPSLGYQVFQSGHIPAGRVIAIALPGLAVGLGGIEFDSVTEGTLHMSDVPAPIKEGTTADPARSLWQTGSICMRVILDVSWAKRAAGAVAFANVAW